MKKILSLTILLIFLLQAHAKIRRVGYTGIGITGTDYANLQAAHDAATAKDTIMLYPGDWVANVSKKIIVLGYGYFIAGKGANANLQNIRDTLTVAIRLNTGADSSIYEGLDNLNIYPLYGQKVNNIIIRRCFGYVFFTDSEYDNWHISQSYLSQLNYLYDGGKITNLRVDNCYIEDLYFYEFALNQSGQFNNSIVNHAHFGNGSFIVRNSIFLDLNVENKNCAFRNCIGLDIYPLPTGNGNRNITASTMASAVFVGYANQSTYSNDGRWALKTGSPAKCAGAGGTDCGIFGGTNPYKLSGIPKIPSFYKLSATSNTTSTNRYTITFSVRSNN